MKEVILYQAFHWTCINCAKTQCCKARFVELSQEERKFLQEDYGFTAKEIADQDFVTTPARVRCRACQTIYKVAKLD